ncbi:uncharacterized protein LOC129738995 [Uranotaenia lowii]|uniref:uncharacterized protein LOC129738995 n=1 Tax=Uranotaenia lowii TaxID=190385 RepID=UPI0024790A7C|nr:uncharacterized protein LOC129738995 [Uranotaenia lowii]
MVKKEKNISGDYKDLSSESDIPQTPLAASTQMSPKKESKRVISYGESASENESEDYQPSSPTSKVSPSTAGIGSKTASLAKEKYLTKFPFVRSCKPRYAVDLDLTDPDDEVWIVQCPSSIDAKKLLLKASLETDKLGETCSIKSAATNDSLEGLIVKNSNSKPITLMTGVDFKSFVPKGTIQVREALQTKQSIQLGLMKEETTSEDIPFPEDIKERHPLLGPDYRSMLKLSKPVRKALSWARQRSEQCYLREDVSSVAEPESPKKAKKRKLKIESNSELVIDETLTSTRKKVKKETANDNNGAQDDLSWLSNI